MKSDADHTADSLAARMSNLAAFYTRRGDFQSAALWYSRSIPLYESSGSSPEFLGAEITWYAHALAETGQLELAEASYARAISVLSESRNAVSLAAAREGLGSIFLLDGRAEEGMEQLEKSRLLLIGAFGTRSMALRQFLERYASILEKTGHRAEAQKLRIESAASAEQPK